MSMNPVQLGNGGAKSLTGPVPAGRQPSSGQATGAEATPATPSEQFVGDLTGATPTPPLEPEKAPEPAAPRQPRTDPLQHAIHEHNGTCCHQNVTVTGSGLLVLEEDVSTACSQTLPIAQAVSGDPQALEQLRSARDQLGTHLNAFLREGAEGRPFHPDALAVRDLAQEMGVDQESPLKGNLAAEVARERNSRLQRMAGRAERELSPTAGKNNLKFLNEIKTSVDQARHLELSTGSQVTDIQRSGPGKTTFLTNAGPVALVLLDPARPLEAQLEGLVPGQHLVDASAFPEGQKPDLGGFNVYEPFQRRFDPANSPFQASPTGAVSTLRAQMDDPEKLQNVAYAELKIADTIYPLGGISGYESKVTFDPQRGPQVEPGDPITAPTRAGRLAHDLGDGNPRIWDSEIQVLDQALEIMARHPGQKASLQLFTERETCNSCRGVIEGITAEVPDLTVRVHYGSPGPAVGV